MLDPVEPSRGRHESVVVVVASDHRLVGEALRAALGSLDVRATLLPGWPPEDSAARRSAGPGAEPPDLLLVVCDLDVADRLDEVSELGAGSGLPWIVLASGEPSPRWGGVLEAGAGAVLGSDVGLEELMKAVRTLLDGGSPMRDLDRRSLMRRWESNQVPEPLARQAGHLSEEESSLLTLLYEGATVRAIAERYELSEAAVRTQIQAALRRLAARR